LGTGINFSCEYPKPAHNPCVGVYLLFPQV
jgi:hypothetical protein